MKILTRRSSIGEFLLLEMKELYVYIILSKNNYLNQQILQNCLKK
jgi:uncharacterized protein YqgQ